MNLTKREIYGFKISVTRFLPITRVTMYILHQSQAHQVKYGMIMEKIGKIRKIREK